MQLLENAILGKMERCRSPRQCVSCAIPSSQPKLNLCNMPLLDGRAEGKAANFKCPSKIGQGILRGKQLTSRAWDRVSGESWQGNMSAETDQFLGADFLPFSFWPSNAAI